MVWFLRPTIFVVVGFLAVRWMSGLISPHDGREPATSYRGTRGSLHDPTSADRVPSPELQPQEVVEIQLAGLAQASPSQASPSRRVPSQGVSALRDHREGVKQCYQFASPNNRLAVGSFEQFMQMIYEEPYRILVQPDRHLVGTPQIQDGEARVMVTVVRDRQIASFVWVLSRQLSPPYVDCWMTDGVFVLNPKKSAASETLTL